MSNILKKLLQRKAMPERVKKGVNHSDTANKDKFLVTMTGEPFQLARVHFNGVDQKEVVRSFEKMKCMDYDAERQRWVWHYDNEATGLLFTTRRKDLPKNIGSIVLGSFYLPHTEGLYLDVNSFDRVIAAVEFFDQYLSREHAHLSHIQIVNKCFRIAEGMFPPKHKSFFDPRFPDTPADEDSIMQEILDDTTLTREEKLSRFQQQMQEDMRKPLSLIESLPIHFYTDGITALKSGLKMRRIIALKNFAGDGKFTFVDIFQQVLPEQDRQNEQGE